MTNMTRAQCDHGDADALQVALCGEPERWLCVTLGGCEEEFTRTRKHHTMSALKHEAACEADEMTRALDMCGCKRRVLACMDCPATFPLDYAGEDVEVWSI